VNLINVYKFTQETLARKSSFDRIFNYLINVINLSKVLLFYCLYTHTHTHNNVDIYNKYT